MLQTCILYNLPTYMSSQMIKLKNWQYCTMDYYWTRNKYRWDYKSCVFNNINVTYCVCVCVCVCARVCLCTHHNKTLLLSFISSNYKLSDKSAYFIGHSNILWKGYKPLTFYNLYVYIHAPQIIHLFVISQFTLLMYSEDKIHTKQSRHAYRFSIVLYSKMS